MIVFLGCRGIETRPMKTAYKTKGFTLIELLVVIAIIAILAAILMPVFASAKQHANQLRCLHNLKQLGFAVRRYIDDNDGRMPNLSGDVPPRLRPDWCGCVGVNNQVKVNEGTLWPYVKNRDLYLCRQDVGRKAEGIGGSPINYPLSYSINSKLQLMKLDGMTNQRPTHMLLIIHESRKTINDGLYVYDAKWDTPDNVHYDGTTVVYCDCHSRWKRTDALLQECKDGYWDPNKNVAL